VPYIDTGSERAHEHVVAPVDPDVAPHASDAELLPDLGGGDPVEWCTGGALQTGAKHRHGRARGGEAIEKLRRSHRRQRFSTCRPHERGQGGGKPTMIVIWDRGATDRIPADEVHARFDQPEPQLLHQPHHGPLTGRDPLTTQLHHLAVGQPM
jgi:hypothetical protein